MCPSAVDQEKHDEQLSFVMRHLFIHLGPLTQDIAPGYAPYYFWNGAAQIGGMAVLMLVYVHQKNHLGLPIKEDVKEGLITYQNRCSWSADFGERHPGAQIRDKRLV